MKIKWTFILLFFPLWLWAQQPSSNILDNFSVTDIPLKEALVQLSEESGTNISFSSSIVPDKIIRYSAQNKSVLDILKALIRNSDLQYDILDDQIVLFVRDKSVKRFILSGYVEDAITGEKLILTNVYNKFLQRGTTTNEFGYYSLRLPPGRQKITVSYLGYEAKVFEIDLYQNKRLNVQLVPSLTLEEVIIQDADTIDNGLIDQTVVRINAQDLADNPAFGGEEDIARLIQRQAGVQTGADGLGGLSIRGGSDDQNLLLVDGSAVYYPNHLFGVFSMLNSLNLRKSYFSKNNFINPYGKRLSSVIDVRTRDGNVNAFSTTLAVNPSSAKAVIEGPLSPGVSSFLIAARRSLSIPIRIFPDEEGWRETAETDIDFYDVNIKFNTNINDKNRLFINAFRGGDQYTYDFDFGRNITPFRYRENRIFEWNNSFASLHWTTSINDNIFVHSLASWSSFDYDTQNASFIRYESDIPNQPVLTGNYLSAQSSIKDISLKVDMDIYGGPNHFTQLGLGITNHTFNPNWTVVKDTTGFLAISENYMFENLAERRLEEDGVNVLQLDLFLQDHVSFGDHFRINYGLFNSFLRTDSSNYIVLLPKVALQYRFTSKASWSFFAQRSAQFFQKIDIDAPTYPNSIWVPVSDRIKPKTSWLISSSLQFVLGNGLSLNLEGYYNWLDEFASLQDGSIFQSARRFDETVRLDDVVTILEGRAYGFECSLTKQVAVLSATFNYTFSKSERRRVGDERADAYFPAPLDRRHIINGSFSLRPSPAVSLSFTATYGDKSPANYIVHDFGQYYTDFDDSVIGSFESRETPFIGANVRYDANIRWTFKTGLIRHALTLGFYNIGNRENELYRLVDVDPLDPARKTVETVHSLGIQPILSYRFLY